MARASAIDGEPFTVGLTFRTGQLRGRTFQFEAPRRIVIGRSQDADLPVLEEKVSRRHCALVLGGSSVVVQDLGSTCGTFVNGARVSKAELHHGDVLALADVQAAIEVAAPSDTQVLPRPTAAAPGGTPILGPGGAVGPYRIVQRLGEGMTGPVFEALDASGRSVAIKVLRVDASVLDEDRIRFEREAHTAAQFSHPNVIRILDYGRHGDAPFIAMELVRGRTLLDWVNREGPLPVAVALHLTRQIASALELARVHEIVHRDVKPENVIVEPDGTAKLMDFGLAKVVERAGGQVTHVGDVLGTLAYMSPEQLDCSATADHRADVYSLGATLYHLLAGQPPYEAEDPEALAELIATASPPAIEDRRRDVPPIVLRLVERCMKKKVVERTQTAGEVVRVCDQLLSPTHGSETAH